MVEPVRTRATPVSEREPAAVWAAEQTEMQRLISRGAVTIDPAGWAVTVNGRSLALTVSEFLLLYELVHRAPRFLDRRTLDAVLQRAQGLGVRGERASLRSVDILVSRLRRKLQAAGCDGIQTMRHVGYRFMPGAEPATRAG